MQVRVDPTAFLELGRRLMGLRGHLRRQEQLRRFKSHFGTTDVRCTLIWNMLRADDNARRVLQGARPEHLLWGLMLIKTYDTEPILAGKAGCDEKTFRKWASRFVQGLSFLLPKVVVFDRRFRGVGRHHHTMSVDGTDCRINSPTPFSRTWYSHKFHAAGVRYEVGVSLRKSEIVWVNGPFRCGSNPDITIFRRALKQRLRRGERIMADKGYRGEPDCIDVPKDDDPPALTRLKRRIGARHETVNYRLKTFRCLSEKFRHDLRKHQMFFHAVTVVTQVNITNGDPLFSVF